MVRLSGESKAILGVASLVLAFGCGARCRHRGRARRDPAAVEAAAERLERASRERAAEGIAGTGVAGTGSGDRRDRRSGRHRGDGGSSDPHAELPACVKELIAACPATGACVIASAGSNTGVPMPFCFANGVHAVLENSGNPTNRTQVSKPDGSPCYTYDNMGGGGGVWKDPAGNVVATATSTLDSSQDVHLQITCAVGGETQVCDGASLKEHVLHQRLRPGRPGRVPTVQQRSVLRRGHLLLTILTFHVVAIPISQIA